MSVWVCRVAHELEARVEVYERLLQDVQPHLSHRGLQLAIDNALVGVSILLIYLS